MQAAVDFVARCLASYSYTALGGMKFVQLTQQEYDELEEYDNSTIYVVSRGTKIVLYVGSTSVVNALQAGYAALEAVGTNTPMQGAANAVSGGINAISGNATFSQIGG